MKLLILVLLTLNSVFPDAKIAEKNEGYRLKFKAEENGKIILGEWLLGKDLQKKELSFYGSDGKQNSYQGISRIQIQRNEYSIMIHEYNSENNEKFIYKAEFIPEKKLYDFRFLISPKLKRPKGKYANVQYDRRVYDTKGNLRIQEYYDSKNTPVLFNGISRTEYVWNKTDYLTEIKNLVCESPERDFEGNSCRLVNDDSGIAQNVSEYDSFGRKIFEKNYDQEKKLALDKYKNEASAVYSYENQSTSEIRKYGADGKPILDSRGVHKYIYTYNKSKKLTEMQFFGIENQPVQNLEGHSASRYEYDTDGRKISEEHFTAPGLRSNKNGIERREFSYDSVYADAVSAESFFRYSGQQKIPAADSEGIHSYRYSFSDYCIEGKTRNTIDSMDSETFKSKSYNEDRIRGYHASACRDSVTFIGLNGQPTQNSRGAVREEYAYSEFLFEKTAEVYYGKNFEYNPELQYTKYIIGTDYFTNHPNDAEFERIKFDRAGNQILKEKIGKDGKLSSRTVRKFDRFNNEILTEYWSSENELTQDTIPSVYVYSYDENCMNLKKSPKDCLAFLESYNFKREAVSLPNKPARVRKKYDHNGNIIFSEYFSSDGKPYAENGIFRSLQTYEKKWK